MKTFALDTNIISYLLRNDAKVIDIIKKKSSDGHEIIIPPIVYYEVMRGLLAVGAVRKLKLFNALCAKTVIGEIDRAILDKAAEIYVDLRHLGRMSEDADIIIAAFCLVNDCILVTANTKHFENINGLNLENWT